MRFEFGDCAYIIDFERTYRQLPVPDGKVGRHAMFTASYPYTTVNILKVDDPKDPKSKVSVFRTYTVGCYHRDRFSLEEGRKAALRGVSKGNSLSKEFKSVMWKAYMTRGKKQDVPASVVMGEN